MARIPDATAFGARPSPQPTSGIPNIAATGAGVARGADIMAADASQAGRGAQMAAAGLADIGERFAAADLKIRSSREAVERARAVGDFSTQAEAELRRMSMEEDLSSLDSAAKYGKFLNDKFGQLLESHGGSEESRNALATRLTMMRAEYSGKMGALGTEAQQKLVANRVDHEINGLVARVYDTPGSLNEMLASLDGTIQDMAPALGGNKDKVRDHGRQVIAKAAVQSLIDRGSPGEAKALLETVPGLKDALGKDITSVNSAITVAQVTLRKKENEFRDKVSGIERVLGKKLDEGQLLRLAGIESKGDTLADKIATLEKLTGQPATQEQITQMAGATTRGAFGEGLTGNALEIFARDTPAFAAGLLPAQKEREYIAAVTQYTQQTTFQNPDTGVMETRRPELPPFVADAMRQRGMATPSAAGTPLVPSGPQPGAPQPGAPQMPPAGEPQQSGPAVPTGRPDKTIWSMSSLIAGPIPAIAEAAGRTPLIGDLVSSPQMTQAINFVSIVKRDLTRTLQNNPRYAEGERKAIEDDIQIDSSLHDRPDAYRNRLIAIDDALAVREKNAYNTSRNPKVGRDERVQAMNVLNAIVNFRESLGVPPILTPEEAKQMPSGTQFRTNDGRLKVVP